MRFKRFWISLTKFLTLLFSNKRLSYKRNCSPRGPIIHIVVQFNVHLMRKSTEQTALKKRVVERSKFPETYTEESLFHSNKTGKIPFSKWKQKTKAHKSLFSLAKLKSEKDVISLHVL